MKHKNGEPLHKKELFLSKTLTFRTQLSITCSIKREGKKSLFKKYENAFQHADPSETIK